MRAGTGQDRTLDTPGDLPSRLGVLLSETVGRASFGHASNHTDVIDDRPFLASKGVFGPSPRGLARGTSVRQISRQLRRAPSTVSREVRRHGGRRRYRAATADAAAWARGRRPKRCRLAMYPALRDAVAT